LTKHGEKGYVAAKPSHRNLISAMACRGAPETRRAMHVCEARWMLFANDFQRLIAEVAQSFAVSLSLAQIVFIWFSTIEA